MFSDLGIREIEYLERLDLLPFVAEQMPETKCGGGSMSMSGDRNWNRESSPTSATYGIAAMATASTALRRIGPNRKHKLRQEVAVGRIGGKMESQLKAVLHLGELGETGSTSKGSTALGRTGGKLKAQVKAVLHLGELGENWKHK